LAEETDAPGFAYRIAGYTHPRTDIRAPIIEWDERVTLHADDVLPKEKKAYKRDHAEDFLRTLLSDGPRESNRVEAQAKAQGYSRATLRRAKTRAGIEVKRQDFGWVWYLEKPTEKDRSAQDAQHQFLGLKMRSTSASGLLEMRKRQGVAHIQ
jgi:hypothetical protein